ncbi:hypothetical protein [Streptococcus ferus]|uniref:hypothetical protein n=1 Tax=Streptococcus ferus TaxID=1345 RepID=UPI0035A0AD4C
MKTLNKEKANTLGVPQYVKRPIPAYAIQLIEKNRELLENEERLDFDNRIVSTLEGQFNFEIGDYFIIGNDNEVWTVKEKIFEATYEPVMEAEI